MKTLTLRKIGIFILVLTTCLLSAKVSMAAISIIDSGATGVIDGANISFTFGTSPSTGDVVILFGGHPHQASTNLGPLTSGYTPIASYQAAAPNFGAWYKVMGTTPDSSAVVYGDAVSTHVTAYGYYVLRGVDSGNVMDVTRTTSGPTTAVPRAPNITTATDGAWVIAMAGSVVRDTAIGTISGYSNQVEATANDGTDFSVGGATGILPTSGVATPGAWSAWTSSVMYAITAAVRPYRYAPTVQTQPVTNIGNTTASGSGNITNAGEPAVVTRRGFAYIPGTSGNPTTSDSVFYEDGTFGAGAYLLAMSGFSPGTAYRVRAYAVNAVGTSYGTTEQFSTTSGIVISGTLYQTDETTAYQCGTNGSVTINMLINGAGSYSGTCSSNTGAWSSPSLTVTAGQTITVYTSGGTVRGTTTLITDANQKTDVPIMQDRVVLRDDADGTINIHEISHGNKESDPDQLVVASDLGGTYWVGSSYETHIYTGDAFDANPTFDGYTGKLHVVGNFIGDSSPGATFALKGAGTGNSRPLYIDGGTFSPPTVVAFQGTATTDIQNTTYVNLSLTPTITEATAYSFLGATSVTGTFTVNPTSTGSNALTATLGGTLVAGSATISGTTSGTSVLNDAGYQITSTGTLNLSGGSTFKLGSAGTATTYPAFSTNNISAGTTVEYASGVGQTISTTPTYSNLTFSGAGTKTTASGTLTVGGNWAVGSTTALNSTNTTVSVTGDLSGSGTITQGSNSLTLGGNWFHTGTFTAGSTSVILNGTLKVISGPPSAISFYDLKVDGTYTNQVTSTITVNSALSGSGTLTQGTNALLDIKGNAIITKLLATGVPNTVSFTGANQSILGSYLFHNLSITGSSTRTVTFGGNTVTFVGFGGTLTLSGATSNPLTLASSDANPWKLNVDPYSSTVAVSNVNVSKSDASGFKQIDASNGTNSNDGANLNWLFAGTSSAPTFGIGGVDIQGLNFD